MNLKISNNLPFKYVLLFVPILFIILSTYIRNQQGPYYQAFFLDPSYAYLMNSLNVVNGKPIGHTDHPGTTIQLLGGAVLKLDSLVAAIKGETESISMKVIKDPERYIKQINNILIYIVAITVFFFGFQIYLSTQQLGLAIISQAFPLTFWILLDHLPRLEPEPLLIACGYMLGTILVPVATDDLGETSSLPRAFIAGITVGIGLMTKVTFAPLLLFLLVFREKKAKILALIVLSVTIFILIIPIWERIPQFAKWLIRLAIYSGRFGYGDIGLPATSTLLGNAIDLIKNAPLIFCFIPVLLYLLLFIKRKLKFSSLYRLLIISFITLIICLAITIKHYAAHYIMQIIALSGFIFFIIALTFSFQKKIIFILSIICVFFINNAISQAEKNLEDINKFHDQQAKMQEAAIKYGCRTVNYYRSSSPQYALMFGNNFAGDIYRNDLFKLYPEYLSYNVWDQRFWDFHGPLNSQRTIELIKNSYLICLLGSWPLPYEGQPAVKIIEQIGQTNLYQFLGFNDQGLEAKTQK